MNADNKKWFLLIDNPSKSNHLGTLLRCAAAFEVHQVLLVGYDKFNCRGSFGSHLFLDIVAFHCWEAVMDYLKSGDCFSANAGESGDDSARNHAKQQMHEDDCAKSEINSTQREDRDVTIIGILGAYGGGDDIFSTAGVEVYEHSTGYVSIVPPSDDVDDSSLESCNEQMSDKAESRQSQAQPCPIERGKQLPSAKHLPHKSLPIHTRPFSTNACFLVSKDRRGLPISHARLCDGFVHVPHLNIFDKGIHNDDLSGTLSSRKQATNKEIMSTTETSTPSLQSMPLTKQQTIIAHPSLLDAATTLSIVLHHYTAWAGYKERTFSENQKFVKDVRPSRVRYLGVGQAYKGNDNYVTEGEKAGESEGYDGALSFWKDDGSSDY